MTIIHEGLRSPFLIALHKKQDDIYGVHVQNNEVFRLNLTDRKLHYCGRIPVFSPYAEKPVHSVLCHQNLCFFIPFHDNANLYIYNCDNGLWRQIELEILRKLEMSQGSEERKPGYFYGSCVYQNQLFLLPFGCRHLIKYNIETGEVSDCVDFGDTILREDLALFHKFAWLNSHCIALSCLYSNHVVLFDLETNEMEIKTVKSDGYRFSTIIREQDDFWIVVKNKLAFLKWNPGTGYTEEFETFPTGCMLANDRHSFDESNIYLYHGFLYCFPAACNMAVKFDLRSGDTQEILPLRRFCQSVMLNRELSTFDGGVREGKKVYLHYQLGKILEFDLETEEIQEYDRFLGDTADMEKRRGDNFASLWEAISQKSGNRRTQENQTAGEKIHGAISKFIL